MTRLANISGKDAVRVFEKFGYLMDHQTGSHARYLDRVVTTPLLLLALALRAGVAA